MRQLRSQQEIMASWKADPDQPVVSICCITYNHEPYIEDALEGFLIQETDFPFEILIHDDASTDRTADIIREYEAKYPKLIKPIYQVQNQYQQGRKINSEFNFTRTKGEFIAICEGDDYWIDCKKLSTQTHCMREQKNVHLSYHSAQKINDNGEEEVISEHGNKRRIFSAADVIRGGGGFCPTASLIITKHAADSLNQSLLALSPAPDYLIKIQSSLPGGALYIPKTMCVYRSEHPGSWTSRQKQSESRQKFLDRLNLFMTELDSVTNHQFTSQIKLAYSDQLFSFLKSRDVPIEIRLKYYSTHSHILTNAMKLLWHLFYSKPKIHNFLSRLRDRLRRIMLVGRV